MEQGMEQRTLETAQNMLAKNLTIVGLSHGAEFYTQLSNITVNNIT